MPTFSGENWAHSCDRRWMREVSRQDARDKKRAEPKISVKVKQLTKAPRRKS